MNILSFFTGCFCSSSPIVPLGDGSSDNQLDRTYQGKIRTAPSSFDPSSPAPIENPEKNVPQQVATSFDSQDKKLFRNPLLELESIHRFPSSGSSIENGSSSDNSLRNEYSCSSLSDDSLKIDVQIEKPPLPKNSNDLNTRRSDFFPDSYILSDEIYERRRFDRLRKGLRSENKK